MLLHMDVRLGIFVVAIALFQGGRWERLIALLFAIHGALNLLAPGWDWHQLGDWQRWTLFQAGFTLLFAAIAWRHRVRWLAAMALLQAGSVGIGIWCALHLDISETMRPAFFLLAIGKSAVLGVSVAYRHIAHPRSPPRWGQPDPDLLGEARARWPNRLRLRPADL